MYGPQLLAHGSYWVPAASLLVLEQLERISIVFRYVRIVPERYSQA